ncbi:hypothetical protein N9W76_05165, partial [Planktomarina temperata]|nr:hypothetical protein [Planktomarina temperata]
MNLAVSDVNGVQKIAADQYFVDENGKLMDSQGRVVIDNSGTAVVETKASDNSRVAAVVAAGASVSVGSGVGGAPIRLFGSIIDTDIGGTINIDGTGVLDLDGNIGQVYSDASLTPPTGANPTAINIQGLGTEQVHLRGDFNAHDTLKITGEDINVLEGALLKTWTAGSTLDIIGAGNILVQAQQLETGLGNATISSADTTHVRGKTIYISGDINAAKTAWINASRDVSVYGSISAKTGDATTLVHIRAGLANSVADATAAGSSVIASSLASGSIFVMGAANIKSDGTVRLDAGTDVVLDASASATAGDRTVQTPVLSTKTVTSQVITGYTQVVDGVIDVPVVKWVDTTVTEQVGLESVKVGYTYTTMDVTLNQLGYFNGTYHREYFIEGSDYRNSANSAGNSEIIDWSSNGLAAPSETYVEYKPGSSAIFSDYREPTFGELNDAQRALVLSTLGYKPVYSFAASNLEIHRVVNGNATKGVWTPSWSLSAAAGEERLMHRVNLPVDGISDIWIEMPVGAEDDLARAVTKNAGLLSPEIVGSYNDTAQVYYNQIKSDWETAQRTATEVLADPNEGTAKSKNTVDFDGMDSVWEVVFDGGNAANRVSGETVAANNAHRNFTLTDGTSVSRYRIPEWAFQTAPLTSSEINSLSNSDVGLDFLGREVVAPSDFLKTGNLTASLTMESSRANTSDVRNVGTDYAWDPKTYHLSGHATDHVTAANGWTLANATNATQAYAIEAAAGGNNYWFGMLNGEDHQIYYDVKYFAQGNGAINTSFWAKRTYDFSGFISTYSNWNRGEPNEANNREHPIQAYSSGSPDLWNDLPPWSTLRFVYEAGNRWVGTTKTEDFTDYRANWTSTSSSVTDTRAFLDFQWVSNDQPFYQNRPKFRTYDLQTKVVETAKQTLYKDVAQTQEVTKTVTVRILSTGAGDAVKFQTYDTEMIDVAKLNITANRDAVVSGLVKTSGDMTVKASRDASVASTRTQTVNGQMLPASTSELQVGADLVVEATRDGLFDRASMIAVTGDVTITTGGSSLHSGELTAVDVAISSGDGLRAYGKIRGNNLVLSAGTDGTGGVSTNLRTDIETDVNLTVSAGSSAGDITFTQSRIVAVNTLSLTAPAGAIYASGTPLVANKATIRSSGDVIGDVAGSGAFLLNASILDAVVSGSGEMWLHNGLTDSSEAADLQIIQATTAQNTIRLTVDGDVNASLVQAGSSALAEKRYNVSISTSLSGEGLNDSQIDFENIYGATIALNAGTTVVQGTLGELRGDRLNISVSQGVTLDQLNVGILDAVVANVGDMNLTAIGSGNLVLQRAVTKDGFIGIESARNIILSTHSEANQVVLTGLEAGRSSERTAPAGLDTLDADDSGVIELDELPLDVRLTTAGKVTATGSGPQIGVDTDLGGAVEIFAATGIENVVLNIAELREAKTTAGDITISISAHSNLDSVQITNVRNDDGDISIETAEAAEVAVISAAETGNVVVRTLSGDLTYHGAGLGGDYLVRDASGAIKSNSKSVDPTVADGYVQNLTFDAGNSLIIGSGIWLDAVNLVRFETGANFEIPTTETYKAQTLQVVSAQNIASTKRLSVGDDAQTTNIDINSGGDITLSAPLSTRQGAAIDLIELNATGDVAKTIQVKSEETGLRVITGASGREYLEGTVPSGEVSAVYVPSGEYFVDQFVAGDATYYIFDAIDYRTNSGGSSIGPLASSTETGIGATLYPIVSTGGVLSLGTVIGTPTSADVAAGKVVHLRDRGVHAVTALVTAERASMTLSGLTSNGNVSVDLRKADGTWATVSADVLTSNLSALVAAVNSSGSGITAALNSGDMVLSRTNNNPIEIKGFAHTPAADTSTGTMTISGTNLASAVLNSAQQSFASTSVTPKLENQFASKVTLYQAQTPYTKIIVNALSPSGTTNSDVELVAGQDIDLDRV